MNSIKRLVLGISLAGLFAFPAFTLQAQEWDPCLISLNKAKGMHGGRFDYFLNEPMKKECRDPRFRRTVNRVTFCLHIMGRDVRSDLSYEYCMDRVTQVRAIDYLVCRANLGAYGFENPKTSMLEVGYGDAFAQACADLKFLNRMKKNPSYVSCLRGEKKKRGLALFGAKDACDRGQAVVEQARASEGSQKVVDTGRTLSNVTQKTLKKTRSSVPASLPVYPQLINPWAVPAGQ